MLIFIIYEFQCKLMKRKEKTVENSIECTLLVIKLLFLHFVQFILAIPANQNRGEVKRLQNHYYFASLQLIYVKRQLVYIQRGVIREMYCTWEYAQTFPK